MFKNLIEENGGKITYSFTNVTALIVFGSMQDSYKCSRAHSLHVPVLPLQYVTQCLAEMRLIPMEEMRIHPIVFEVQQTTII